MKAVVARIEAQRKAAGVPFRLIGFDPTGEWRPIGAVQVRTKGELWREIARQGREIAAGNLRPAPVMVVTVMTDWTGLAKVRFATIATDEARLFMSPAFAEPGIRDVLCLGRHAGQDSIMASQRPAHLHGDVFANANHAWIHPLGNRHDRTAVEDGLAIDLDGVAWSPVPHAPPAYYPWHWDLAGGLRDTAPGSRLNANERLNDQQRSNASKRLNDQSCSNEIVA